MRPEKDATVQLGRTVCRSSNSFRFSALRRLPAGWWFAVFWIAILFHEPAFAQRPTDPIGLSGFSESQTYELNDARPMELENAFLTKLLYRAEQSSEASLRKYEQLSGQPSRSDLLADPRKYRFRVFKLLGSVIRFEALPFGNQDSRFSATAKTIYRLKIQTPGGFATLFANDLPVEWLEQFEGPQAIECYAFFLKREPEGGDLAEDEFPIYVTNRIRWLPTQASTPLGISSAHVVLASHGFDAALLANIRRRNALEITAKDSESFYQLLACASKVSPSEFGVERAEFVQLLRNATRYTGEPAQLTGQVRRCFAIRVEDPEQQRSLGTDRYYEIDMFFRLNESQIIINSEAGKLTYKDRFPVTVCTTKLPDGVSPQQLARKQVRIEGLFYRFWKYSAEKTNNESRQIAPLLMASEIELIDIAPRQFDIWLTSGVVFVLLAFVAMMIYFRFTDKTDQQRKSLPDKIDLPSSSN